MSAWSDQARRTARAARARRRIPRADGPGRARRPRRRSAARRPRRGSVDASTSRSRADLRPGGAGEQGSESWSATASGTPVPDRVLTPEVQPAPPARPQDPDGGTVVLFTPGEGSQGATAHERPFGPDSGGEPAATAPEPVPENPNPIRAAFYYPWFPQRLVAGGDLRRSPPTTRPSATTTPPIPSVIRPAHRGDAVRPDRSGHCVVVGRDHYTDAHFADLLQVSRRHRLQVGHLLRAGGVGNAERREDPS